MSAPTPLSVFGPRPTDVTRRVDDRISRRYEELLTNREPQLPPAPVTRLEALRRAWGTRQSFRCLPGRSFTCWTGRAL